MIKSYIYDPSAPVEVHGRRHDSSSSSSLCQRKSQELDNNYKIQGFHNLGYSHKYGDSFKNSTSRLEIDNNQINRLHAPPDNGLNDRPLKLEPRNDSLYILNPRPSVHKCAPPCDPRPPLGHSALQTSSAPCRPAGNLDGCLIDGTPRLQNGNLAPSSRDEAGRDDGESVVSGNSEDMHTSTTSLSSAEIIDRVQRGNDVSTGVSTAESSSSSEEEEDEEEDCCGSITDSEVAEALAALEAATAGEDCN